MAIVKLPVSTILDSYNFTISLESVIYNFEFKYNARRKRWLMDIYDSERNPILLGTAMLTNVDIASRFKSESLPPGVFMVFDLSGLNKNPEQFDLGDNVILLYQESTDQEL